MPAEKDGAATGFAAVVAASITAMTQAHVNFMPLAGTEGAPAFAEELCLHLDTLLTVAAGVPSLPDPSQVALGLYHFYWCHDACSLQGWLLGAN